jgi:hypothetical protein
MNGSPFSATGDFQIDALDIAWINGIDELNISK